MTLKTISLLYAGNATSRFIQEKSEVEPKSPRDDTRLLSSTGRLVGKLADSFRFRPLRGEE
jgi:hypothetical protein